MYVGRIVSIARTQAGNVAGMYRVSSRVLPEPSGQSAREQCSHRAQARP